MKPPCLKQVVYRALYPHPRDGDPASFSDFVNRCIVPEVRTETVRFYGPIDDLEAKYPGLDYTAPAHRLRLNHFPYHRKLFDAFDRLGLTAWEIYELCKWEGTKNAKDKYMKHNRCIISDTTFDGIKRDNRPRLPPASYRSTPRTSWPDTHPHTAQPPTSTCNDAWMYGFDGSGDGGGSGRWVYSPPTGWTYLARGAELPARTTTAQAGEAALARENPFFNPDADVIQQSIGISLNQRLRAATAARLRGQELPLDPAYEQWLKEAREQGTIGLFDEIPRLGGSSHSDSPAPSTPGSPLAALPPSRTPTRYPGTGTQPMLNPNAGGAMPAPRSSPSMSSHHFRYSVAAGSAASRYAPSGAYLPRYPVPSSSHPSRHRRYPTLPMPYEPSHYWTRTVPDMFRYGARQTSSPTTRASYLGPRGASGTRGMYGTEVRDAGNVNTEADTIRGGGEMAMMNYSGDMNGNGAMGNMLPPAPSIPALSDARRGPATTAVPPHAMAERARLHRVPSLIGAHQTEARRSRRR